MKTTRSNFTTNLTSKTNIDKQWHGLISYRQGLELQVAAWQRVQAEPRSVVLLGLEHQPVITLGNRGRKENDLADESDSSFEIFEVDRGGQATLHSPGQLVVYPILSLQSWGLGVRDYVQLLERITSEIVLPLGIQTKSANGAGLETANGKIAFIGLRVDRGVTRHGISLNVRNDLSAFDRIRSCGITGQKLDRVHNWPLGAATQPVGLFHDWSDLFRAAING